MQYLFLFSCWVVSDSLWPHGLQHTRLLCPSLSSRVCSNLCPLSRWYYPTISLNTLALPFFRIGMKTDLLQSCGYCWVFQICWHIEYSAFTASSFRIWNSSAGIPSPPLGLFIVMLPKARLTSHSRMSGSRWVIMPLWLSGSWRSFLYSSSVFLPPLLNIFCFC